MTLQSWTETLHRSPRRSRSHHRFGFDNVTWLVTCGLSLSLLLCTPATVAHADAAADAEALIAQGIELRRQGKDAEALALFKQAAETHSTPRALAQMGLAEQALGRWVEAEEHIKLALEHPNHPWISRNRETLTRSLAAVGERLGSIELTCDVAGAIVTVNGKPAGQTPLSAPLRVVAGTVVVELSAEGFHPMTRSLQINAGSLARENVTLVPMRAAVVTPTPVATPDPSSAACEPGQVTVEDHCCWPGQTWNATRQQCAGAPRCPQGLVPSGLSCAPASTSTAEGPVLREHLVVRRDVGPQPTPEPEPVAPTTTEPTTRVAEGGEISLHIGYGGFFRRDAGLFLTKSERGPHAFNLGAVGQFGFGYRPIRWFSFGAQIIGSLQEGDADYWDEQGGEGRLLSVSTGVYFRGHLVGELFAGALDLWVGTGFHPFSRLWVDAKELPNTTVSAMAIPLELGFTVFGSSSFGLELKLSMLSWMPLDYCVSTDGNNVCNASMQSQTSWDAALGFSWVL
jgi:hypothetical protein